MTERGRRIVVTGIGAVSAAGTGIHESWASVQRALPRPTRCDVAAGAQLVSFPLFRAGGYSLEELGVPAAAVRVLERDGLGHMNDVRHMLASVALSLRDAGLTSTPASTGVVVADEHPGFEPFFRGLLHATDGTDPRARLTEHGDDAFRLNSFLYPHALARVFRLHGMALHVNAGCASGLHALDIAANQIRLGRAAAMVVVGADDPISAAKYLWFDRLGMYSESGEARVYDRSPSGLVFGDGGAALVLEELSHALARGAVPYAELLGLGFAQDAWKTLWPDVRQRQLVAAAREALDASGLSASDIDLLVPHAIGTRISDRYEALMFHELFGSQRWPAVAAMKPWLGHNLGGCGVLEVSFALVVLRDGLVPPSVSAEHAPYADGSMPVSEAWERRPLRTFLKTTSGFAGYHAAACFRAFEEAGPCT